MATPSSDQQAVVLLTTNDPSEGDKTLSILRREAERFTTLKHLFEDIPHDEDAKIPVPNVRHGTLTRLCKYVRYHIDDPTPTEEQEQEDRSKEIVGWDAEYLRTEFPTLFDLFHGILAANFLDNKPVLNLLCKQAALLIRGKTDEEICALFGVENNFTDAEKAVVKSTNPWCDPNS